MMCGRSGTLSVFGRRIQRLRVKSGYTQEDIISSGFSARYWQQIEIGRPITMKTLLRICDTFEVRPERLLQGLYRHRRPTVRRLETQFAIDCNLLVV